LQALSNLAPSLGLPEGLEGWERLAREMQSEESGGQNEEKSELERIGQFVLAVVQSVRTKSSEAGKYFEAVSRMAVDSKTPPHYQELGNILKKFMSGVRNPDLSKLPKEMAAIVQKALGTE
ncbi:MAG TPA: hypothetical protein VJM08_06280, partial [Anaerolineales bacterium]|nr:hypothetical protein [Anaerolineales bacterium]